MKRLLFTLTYFLLTLMSQEQRVFSRTASRSPELARMLSLETEHKEGLPGGWGGGPPGTVFVDDKVVHGGRWSARLERKADSPNQFSTITIGFPMDFAGTTIQLRGFLRTEDASDFVGLWMREDGESSLIAFDNMQNQQLRGTHDWKEYSITLPVRAEAKRLFFGVLLAGTGKAWVDDLFAFSDREMVRIHL